MGPLMEPPEFEGRVQLNGVEVEAIIVENGQRQTKKS